MPSAEVLSAPRTIRRTLRTPELVPLAVFVDGIGGCGKSMFSQIIGAMPRVELQQYCEEIEYALALRFMERLDDDVAISLVRLYSDLRLYKSMMGRETNFRPSDLSGAWMNAGTLRYVRRLFEPDGHAAIARIQAQRPILHLVTHNVLSKAEPLFEALGERVRIVEIVRHPLYMIKQWHQYMQDKLCRDARDFTVCFEWEGQVLPWFAKGWEDLYTASNSMDRVIYLIERIGRRAEEVHAALPVQRRAQVLFIPFEPFVLSPQPFMRQLSELLGTSVSPATRRMMKKQRVPRKRLSDGLALKVYKENGWQPPVQQGDEAVEFDLRRRYAAEHASEAGLKTLDRLSRDYEKRWMSSVFPH